MNHIRHGIQYVKDIGGKESIFSWTYKKRTAHKASIRICMYYPRIVQHVYCLKMQQSSLKMIGGNTIKSKWRRLNVS